MESQEEVRKIKDDLKLYKKELLEQDKAKRDLENQQDLKRKMEVDLSKMLSEVENARRNMNDYRLSKFSILLTSVITSRHRHLKGQMFHCLSAYSQHLNFKEQKMDKLRRCQEKSRFFRLWQNLWMKMQTQKELEEYEREQQRIAVKEMTADNHKRRCLKRKVIKAMRKNAKSNQAEREIEREHETRKNTIDEFFVNLKERARMEEEKVKREKLERI